jgi:hypothetical protein
MLKLMIPVLFLALALGCATQAAYHTPTPTNGPVAVELPSAEVLEGADEELAIKECKREAAELKTWTATSHFDVIERDSNRFIIEGRSAISIGSYNGIAREWQFVTDCTMERTGDDWSGTVGVKEQWLAFTPTAEDAQEVSFFLAECARLAQSPSENFKLYLEADCNALKEAQSAISP